MKKLRLSLSFCFILFLVSQSLYAQRVGTIKGGFIDSKTKEGVSDVSYGVKKVNDSSIVGMGASNKLGAFSVNSLPYGQYKFYAAILGYKPILKAFEITAENKHIDFGKIELFEAAITLNDVLIKGELLPMIIKRDTIEFNADAFKTQSDANVEDLLRDMPGMVVDRDGNVWFNGERIDRVLVEGKDFFGNNPKIATQNLPKEIVSKIQIIKRKTDQALFSGVDDGRRQNVLNIVLKEDKKKGVFGNIGFGKGDGSLYEAALNVNRFSGKEQLSIIGSTNNTGRTGFSSSAVDDFFGGQTFSTGLVRGTATGANGNTVLGFAGESVSSDAYGGRVNDNQGAGINYNKEWGKSKKLTNKFYLNYILLRNSGLNESSNIRLNLLGSQSFFDNRFSSNEADISRQRLGVKLDLAIDTTFKIQIAPNIGLNYGDQINSSEFNSYSQANLSTINSGEYRFAEQQRKPIYGGNISLNKVFNKKRGISNYVNFSFMNSGNSVDGSNFSSITVHSSGAATNEIVDQLVDQSGATKSLSFYSSFSMKANSKTFLSINYSYNNKQEDIIRSVYDAISGTTRYELLNLGLTRDFISNSKTQSLGLSYDYYPNEKLKLIVSFQQDMVHLTGDDRMLSSKIDRHFSYLQPRVNLSYKISKTSTFSVNGNRSYMPPSVANLFPLIDNSNPTEIIVGNPNLKSAISDGINVRYNQFNPNSGISLSASLNYGSNSNLAVFNSVLDPLNGVRTSTYTNIKGGQSVSSQIGMGFKIKPINLSISPSFNVGRALRYTYVNNNVLKSDISTVGLSANFSYSVGTVLQLSNYISFSNRKVGFEKQLLNGQEIDTWMSWLNLTTSLPYNFRFKLSSDWSYSDNSNFGSANNEYNTTHVSMEKLFLNKAMVLTAGVNDIFNTGKRVSRQVNDNYVIENIRYGMSRFFTLSLTYRLRKFGETVN